MIEKFKAVVFEKDKTEHRDKSILVVLLPIIAYQSSIYDVEKKSNLEAKSRSQVKKNYRLTPCRKNEAGRAEKEYEFEYPNMSKMKAIFRIYDRSGFHCTN